MGEKRDRPVINLVDLEHDRLDDVSITIEIRCPCRLYFFPSRKQAVQYCDLVAFSHQFIYQVATNKPGAARNEHSQLLRAV